MEEGKEAPPHNQPLDVEWGTHAEHEDMLRHAISNLLVPDEVGEIVRTRDMTDHIHQSNLIEDIDSPQYDKRSQEAWVFLLKQEKLTNEVVKSVQGIITSPQRDLPQNAKGEYRDKGGYNVWIGGRKAPEPYMVETLMDNWLEDSQNMTPSEAHVQFEWIHPFGDGNGRTGRMLMWWHEIQLDREPTLVNLSERQEYYEWFR